MTLDGWTIAKQMYAGLIPGVNISTRPRVFTLYVTMSLNEGYFNVYSALASSPGADTKGMYDVLVEYAIPPFSPEQKQKEETEKMISFLKKITTSAAANNKDKKGAQK